MGKEFDVEVRITAIVTNASFLLCSKVRTIPSRFLLGMKWLEAGTCVVPESGPSRLHEPGLS